MARRLISMLVLGATIVCTTSGHAQAAEPLSARTYYAISIGQAADRLLELERTYTELAAEQVRLTVSANEAMMAIQGPFEQAAAIEPARERLWDDLQKYSDEVKAKFPSSEDTWVWDPSKIDAMGAEYNKYVDKLSAFRIAMQDLTLAQNGLESETMLGLRRLDQLPGEYRNLKQRYEGFSKSVAAFHREFHMLPDYCGLRSRTELLEAEPQIRTLMSRYKPARILLAVTYLRLGDFASAESLADVLVSEQSPLTPIALAVRGEIYARTGVPLKLVNEQFDMAIRLAPSEPAIRLVRAQTLAYLKQPKLAVKEWSTVAAVPELQTIVRSLMVFALTKHRDELKVDEAAILKQAVTTNNNGGDSEWNAQLALAMALAASGKNDEAVAKAVDASKSAVAENKRMCLKVAKAIELEMTPQWPF